MKQKFHTKMTENKISKMEKVNESNADRHYNFDLWNDFAGK